MSMTADLRDRLKPAAAGQVYRDEIPQGVTGKRIRLFTVSDPRPSTHEGRSAFRVTTIQLDCMASSRGDADEIAEAAIDLAEPAGIVGTTRFTRAFVEAVRTYSERAETGVVTYVTSLDLAVWHQPAA